MPSPDASDDGVPGSGPEYRAQVPEALSGKRLDQALAALFPDFSRSRLKAWIKAGRVTVDGLERRPRDPVLGGEQVWLRAEPETRVEAGPEPIPLSVIFEDDTLLVIDKPAGLVVHPGEKVWHSLGSVQDGQDLNTTQTLAKTRNTKKDVWM